MKKYHFYVSPCFVGGYSVCERGRGNHFCVSYPTRYRAQIVARTLWRLWKKHSPLLDTYKGFFISSRDNWELTKIYCIAAVAHVKALKCV